MKASCIYIYIYTDTSIWTTSGVPFRVQLPGPIQIDLRKPKHPIYEGFKYGLCIIASRSPYVHASYEPWLRFPATTMCAQIQSRKAVQITLTNPYLKPQLTCIYKATSALGLGNGHQPLVAEELAPRNPHLAKEPPWIIEPTPTPSLTWTSTVRKTKASIPHYSVYTIFLV